MPRRCALISVMTLVFLLTCISGCSTKTLAYTAHCVPKEVGITFLSIGPVDHTKWANEILGYQNWKKTGTLITALVFCNLHEEIKVDEKTPFFISEIRKR